MIAGGTPTVLDEVRGLVWPARRKTRSALPGTHIAVAHANAAEFVEYRPYRQGDDPGRIDWKLLGRTDRVYVRLSPERSVQPTILVVDASASMAFPTDTMLKWTVAARITLGLAAVARHGGDPVGLAVSAPGGPRFVAPRTRRSVLDEIATALAPPPAGSATVAPLIETAMRHAARVVIIGDFLGDVEAQVGAARRYGATGREVHAVHLVAREELEPARAARLVADPEQPELRRPMPPAARAEYVRRFGEWRTEIARAWRGAGSGYTMIVAGDEPLRQSVRRITT